MHLGARQVDGLGDEVDRFGRHVAQLVLQRVQDRQQLVLPGHGAEQVENVADTVCMVHASSFGVICSAEHMVGLDCDGLDCTY